MSCRIEAIPMILTNLQGHLPIANCKTFKCDLYSFAAVDNISTDISRRSVISNFLFIWFLLNSFV